MHTDFSEQQQPVRAQQAAVRGVPRGAQRTHTQFLCKASWIKITNASIEDSRTTCETVGGDKVADKATKVILDAKWMCHDVFAA